ncbi:MAG: hypothetical protein H2042_10685 [Rhizobiales bacterium]|nr:hypothetical protein [Hyphomicrobiales bacterium]
MTSSTGGRIGPPQLRACVLICAVAVFACVQIWLVKTYGSIIPFWDEWDVQGLKLFRPFLDGTLTLDAIIGTHNEHRPAAGRLVWLFALVTAGYWDTVWMMLLSVLIRAATVFLLARSLATGLVGWRFVLVVLLVLAAFLVPFGWENALWGMQSATYLLIFFGVAANLSLARSPAFSPGWIAGTVLALASYFCMASGAITLVPAIVVALVRLARGERRSGREVAGILVHAALVAACLAAIPKLEYKDNIAAASFSVFWAGLVRFASWPAPESLPAMVALNLPVALVFLRLVLARTERDAPVWGPVMAALWVHANILIFAYGRGGSSEVASRHTDMLALGIAINLGLAVRLTDGLRGWKLGGAGAAVALWLAMMGLLLEQKAMVQVPDGLAWRQGTVMVQTQKLAGFFATDDVRELKGQPHAFIPYPNPDRLAADLRDPYLRPILPAALTGLAPQHHVSEGGVARAVNRATAILKSTLLRNAWSAIWVSFGLLVVACGLTLVADWRRGGREASGAPTP